ncbi:Dihydroorotate dehydrogenase (quinone), mitochondrial [Boothiomyces macroporosus]|uniref:Dihydroorotate dehydrogenase (quinone), mitochondrial n=1 Tax=Boothiomyces macroporosus TaxID=261099 RepID=A0AAD5UKH0_9FUNG|nr:Dihydroorotate dehydrogenase (quinone), mitochondrial [Boothiomyces macroporosus]
MTTRLKSPSFLRAGLTAAGGLVAGTLLYFYAMDSRALMYKWGVMPLMHTMDAEDSHNISIWCAKYGLVPRDVTKDSELLKVKLWNKEITNPVGLAAGYDKNGEAVDSLLNFGFGLVEIGSVTPLPQAGNPKPRFFRLPSDDAVINRYGFNSVGHSVVLNRLKHRLRKYFNLNPLSDIDDIPRSLQENKLLGVNLGKNKLSPADSHDDYINGVKKLGPMADYIVINISSPNTPGLRSLQRREPIQQLLGQAIAARNTLTHKPPLLVKIAPDCSDAELEDIAHVVKEVGIDGIIISNTTISRPKTLTGDEKIVRQMGGLSGAPVKPLALATVSKFYKLTNGSIPIVGCGGIATAEDALQFCRAGATVVQLYTSLGYRGPGIVPEIKDGLTKLLRAEGKTWMECIGSGHQK